MMWLSILLTFAVLVGTVYWFGFLQRPDPASSKRSSSSRPEKTPVRDEPTATKKKKTEKKKRQTKKTAPKKSTLTKEKRKLPTDPRFLRRFGGHSDSLTAMSISPNGEWIATAGKDGQVRVAQVEKGSNRYMKTMVEREQQDLLFQDHLSALSWSGDGRTLVGTRAHSHDVSFFRIRHKKDQQQDTAAVANSSNSVDDNIFPYELHELVKRQFSTSSKVHDTIDTCLVDQAHTNFCLVITNTSGGDRGNTVAWDGKTGEAVGVLSTGNGGVRFSPDGRFLCGQGGAGVAQVKMYEVLRKKVKGEVEPVFDSLSHKGVMTVVPGKAKIDDIAFCRGDKCVVCCDDGSIQVWDLDVEYRQREDPKLLCTSSALKGSKIIHVATSFLEDINRIAVVTDDSRLHILAYDSLSSTMTLKFAIDFTHSEGVADLQFCPATGKVLYTRGAYPSKDVFAWDIV